MRPTLQQQQIWAADGGQGSHSLVCHVEDDADALLLLRLVRVIGCWCRPPLMHPDVHTSNSSHSRTLACSQPPWLQEDAEAQSTDKMHLLKDELAPHRNH